LVKKYYTVRKKVL